jgi:four helix bundle protein
MPLPYRQLEVWRRSQDLALELMAESKRGDWDRFLRDQVCRSAFSVPANIAEGNGRSTPNDYAAFVDRARGSLYELDSWLGACQRLGLLSLEHYGTASREVEELSAMLLVLVRRLRSKPSLESRR